MESNGVRLALVFFPTRSIFTPRARENFSVAMYSIPGNDTAEQRRRRHVGLMAEQASAFPRTGQFQEGDPFFGYRILRRQVHGDDVPGVVAELGGYGVALQSRSARLSSTDTRGLRSSRPLNAVCMVYQRLP